MKKQFFKNWCPIDLTVLILLFVFLYFVAWPMFSEDEKPLPPTPPPKVELAEWEERVNDIEIMHMIQMRDLKRKVYRIESDRRPEIKVYANDPSSVQIYSGPGQVMVVHDEIHNQKPLRR